MATAVVAAVAEAVAVVAAEASEVAVAVPVMDQEMAPHVVMVLLAVKAVAVALVVTNESQKTKCCKLGGFDQAFVLN